jgi:hypothetical protein
MAITIDLKLGGNALTDLDNYADAMAKIAPLAKQTRDHLAGSKNTWLTKAANEAERLNKALAQACLLSNQLAQTTGQISQMGPVKQTNNYKSITNNRFSPPRTPRAPAIPNTPGVSIARSLLSTRFPVLGSSMLGKDVLNIAGINPQAVLKSVAALGPAAEMAGAALGPLAVAAIAVTAAFNVAQLSAGAINADRRANAASGGSAAQSASANAIAGSIGLNGSAISGLSNTIAGGGAASAIAMQLGISPVRGGLTGDMNDAKAFTKVTDYLRRIKRPEDALRTAELLGNRDLVQVRDMSQGTYDRLKKVQGSTQEQRTAAADFDAEMVIFNKQLDQLKYSLSPVVREFATFTGGINDFLNIIQGKGGSWDAVVKGLTSGGIVAGNPIVTSIGQIVEHLMGGDSKKQEAAAREKQTRAINENTRAIKQSREIIGGGSRAQGAIPSGITGREIDAAIRAQGIQLGFLP